MALIFNALGVFLVGGRNPLAGKVRKNPTWNYLRVPMNRSGESTLLIVPAFLAIYFIWGSTYLAIWFVIQEVPPFLMAGLRFLAAGLLIYLPGKLLLGFPRPRWEHWRNGFVLGTLFMTIGNGGLVWAEQYLPSGMTALILASQPLVVVLLLWGMYKVRPLLKTFLGIGLGLLGMVLLLGQDLFIGDERALWGLVALAVSLLGWAYGSVKVKHTPMPASNLQSAAMQMICGGVGMLLISAVLGEPAFVDWSAVGAKAVWSWVYLVVFGSIVAFSAFNYLLLRVSPEKVSTSTYVNPVVALLLGWALNAETINLQTALAALVLLTGVFFITARAGTLRRLGRALAPRRG